ncbi:hypothetical protein [Ruegeria atlantica]|uniref:hypothetical protein n=1 Tax=Ruegeria atlantica TaxID=81569 RepID=UPI00147BB37A|nr:hypothetical protein [Ruegeria atlantica]
MKRSTLNVASFCLVGFVLATAALMLAFFASPQAVRTSPPAVYNTLLLETLSTR